MPARPKQVPGTVSLPPSKCPANHGRRRHDPMLRPFQVGRLHSLGAGTIRPSPVQQPCSRHGVALFQAVPRCSQYFVHRAPRAFECPTRRSAAAPGARRRTDRVDTTAVHAVAGSRSGTGRSAPLLARTRRRGWLGPAEPPPTCRAMARNPPRYGAPRPDPERPGSPGAT